MTGRIVLSIAASLDGFIARTHGEIDWLPEPDAAGRGEDYGMGAFFESVDTIVWGRRTFDESLPRGGVAPFGPRMRHVVLTRRAPPATSETNVEFASGPIAEVARRVRRDARKDVWLMGGGQVVSAFLDAGELDEIVVHVIPVLLGEGVPLAPGARTARLRLRDTRAYADGVVMLRYDVERAERTAAQGSSL